MPSENNLKTARSWQRFSRTWFLCSRCASRLRNRCNLVHPVTASVSGLISSNLALVNPLRAEEVAFLVCPWHGREPPHTECGSPCAPLFDAEVNCDTNANLIVEDVSAFAPTALAACARIAFEIDNPDLVELLRDHLPEAIEVRLSMKDELLTNARCRFRPRGRWPSGRTGRTCRRAWSSAPCWRRCRSP